MNSIMNSIYILYVHNVWLEQCQAFLTEMGYTVTHAQKGLELAYAQTSTLGYIEVTVTEPSDFYIIAHNLKRQGNIVSYEVA